MQSGAPMHGLNGPENVLNHLERFLVSFRRK